MLLSSNNILFVFSIGILMFLIPSATSLKCYVCNAHDLPECEDKPTVGFIAECEPRTIKQSNNMQVSIMQPTGCSIAYLEDLNPFTQRITSNIQRGCYYGDPKLSTPDLSKDMGCDGSVVFNYKTVNCTICTNNLCNSGASSILASVTLITLFVFIFQLILR